MGYRKISFDEIQYWAIYCYLISLILFIKSNDDAQGDLNEEKRKHDSFLILGFY